MKIKEPEMIYKSGKPTAVILPLADYEELLERVDDAADVQWLKQARVQGVSYRPFSDYLKKNKKAEEKFAMMQSLEKIKGFLLELKASL